MSHATMTTAWSLVIQVAIAACAGEIVLVVDMAFKRTLNGLDAAVELVRSRSNESAQRHALLKCERRAVGSHGVHRVLFSSR